MGKKNKKTQAGKADAGSDVAAEVDRLFAQLAEMEYAAETELQWLFPLESSDNRAMRDLGDKLKRQLGEGFSFEIDEAERGPAADDEEGEIGEAATGTLTVIYTAAADADEIRKLARRLSNTAKKNKMTLGGIDCFDPNAADDDDDDPFAAWHDAEMAAEILDELTAEGLEPDTEIPWVFLVLTPDLEASESIAKKLNKEGFPNVDVYEQPVTDEDFAIGVFVTGRNDKRKLRMVWDLVNARSLADEGEVIGVQFLTREEMYEGLADDGEEISDGREGHDDTDDGAVAEPAEELV